MNRVCRTAFLICLGAPVTATAGELELGLAALEGKDYPEAVTHLSAHIKTHPRDAFAYFQRGNAYYCTMDYDKALADFTASIEIIPRSPSPYLNRGIVYGCKKEYDKSLKDLDKALELGGGTSRLHYNRGFIYESMGQFDKAFEDYSAAIALEPRHALSHINRGAIFLARREYDKTIGDFSSVLETDKSNTMARLNRANAYCRCGEYKTAVDDCLVLLKYDPDDYESHMLLGWIRATCPKAALRDGDKAIINATKACELSKWKSARAVDALAAAHAEKQDFEEAVRIQIMAITIGHPSDSEATGARERLELYKRGRPYREAEK